MSEIKKELITLGAGNEYTAQEGDVLITEQHTIMDIIRYLHKVTGNSKEELACLVGRLPND